MSLRGLALQARLGGASLLAGAGELESDGKAERTLPFSPIREDGQPGLAGAVAQEVIVHGDAPPAAPEGPLTDSNV